jgi:hypothetical protein
VDLGAEVLVVQVADLVERVLADGGTAAAAAFCLACSGLRAPGMTVVTPAAG